MNRYTRKALAAVFAILAVIALAWEFVPLVETRWVGSFDLTVRVECRSGRPQSVSGEVFAGRDEALLALQAWLHRTIEAPAAGVVPFDGGPLTVRVCTTGRDSPLGRELSRVQSRYLVVIAVLPGGRRVGTVAEIPDGRACREMTIDLP